MWTQGWRDRLWSGLDGPWDLIVIGGGVTGAGILREAVRAGWRTLLVEAHDFASGASSRSSKLVHGGLRYLSHGQIRLTAESVRERERLLAEGPGLIEPLDNLLASYQGDRPPAWVMAAGLAVYDILARKWRNRRYGIAAARELCPQLETARMAGAFGYVDATTDDARLTLRVIQEAVLSGGAALSYAPATNLLRDSRGRVQGVALRDQVTGAEREVRSPVVISAAGAWADELRAHAGASRRLRPLRGSHLFFPWRKLPLTRCVGFLHPVDRRPVFAYPWEGVTILGTTDVDQGREVPADPTISPAEIDYLMQAATHAFRPAGLSEHDVLATQSGIRPVVDSGQANPSKESRDFVLWDEQGLLTITGGKLTTFRVMALKALDAVRRRLPEARPVADHRVLALCEGPRGRIPGRYGADARRLLDAAQPGELEPIGETRTLWAELRWAARAEGVVHLEDLLLRRTRLGILTPEGGRPFMTRIQEIAQPELGWDDARWRNELESYYNLWRRSYRGALSS
ncbi:MAG: glycerol-3-phosphate dehydrogenase/oxidase [Acidobacteria bacterium]|nr:glycerol-3-phosphate dehydrogenase/oxidase [Acidobacteriota bacterium]